MENHKKEDSKNQDPKNQIGQAYQYTRAIRFKLDPQRQTQDFEEKWKFSDSKVDLNELAKLLSKIYTDLTDLLFYKDKKETNSKGEDQTNKSKWSKKLSVSKNWLKIWHKNIFYLSIKNKKNKQSKYNLQELEDLYDDIKKWLTDWKEQANQLEKYSKQPKEAQARHSDIAYIIRRFLNNKRLPYIQNFLSEAHTSDSNLDNQIKTLKNNLEQLQKDLKKSEQDYLSSDSSGIEIAKASFNYYTVNKKPKDGYEKQLKNIKRKLYGYKDNDNNENKDYYSKIDSIIENKQDYIWYTVKHGQKGQTIYTFKSDQEKEWLKRYIDQYKKK